MNTIHRHIFASVVMTCAASVGLFGVILMWGNALKDLLPLVLAEQLALDTFLPFKGLGAGCFTVSTGHEKRS